MNTSAEQSRTTNRVWQLVEKLDEQRQYPRVPLDIKIALRNDAGEKFAGLALNISPDGLQMRCDVHAGRLLLPNGGTIDAANRPQVNLAAALTTGGVKKTLVARAEVLYITTVDTEPRCVVGLCFVRVDPQADRILNAFFADQLGLEPSMSVA
jgi:hypothetical protein